MNFIKDAIKKASKGGKGLNPPQKPGKAAVTPVKKETVAIDGSFASGMDPTVAAKKKALAKSMAESSTRKQ